MLPTEALTGGILDSLFVYFSVLGILILIATVLRLKIPFLKKYFIPASLIAGFIGLFLGPHFLGIIPQRMTSAWSAMSGRLIVLVFAPILMGKSVKHGSGKDFIKRAVSSMSWSYAACALQYAVPILLTVFLLTPMFGVDPLFGVILEEGWAGGHGTAGGMAIVFEELGWKDGQSLAVTSATIGLVFGIFGGIVLINLAARRGWSSFLSSGTGIRNDDVEVYTGDERPVDTRKAVSGGVVDNLAFHAALLSVTVFIGWIANKLIRMWFGFSVAWFVTALFAGFILQKILDRTPWGDAVDKATLSRIQGIALEFLVAGAVASVNVPVVVAYAMPLIIQQGVMMVVMLIMNIWYARRVLGKYWFEHSMLLFGTFTGVAATGMLLLKTCDPMSRSDVLAVYAARTPFSSWAIGGGVITSLAPFWIVKYGALNVGLAFAAAFAVAFLVPVFIGNWHKQPLVTQIES